MCAGSENQVKQIIEQGIIDKLIHLATTDALEVQREAIWALSNSTANKRPEIIKVLVEKGIIQVMCTWLDKNDTKSIIIILEGLRNILAVGKHFFNNEF